YITQHKITHVLNVTHHQHMSSFNHVEYLRIAIDDAPKVNIAEFFDVATAFIDSARKRPDGRILVHCYAGVSRSVSMVLAYLIRFHECTLLQAFDVVYRNRPVAQPNEGFARKLQKY
ncbi:protein-tyrosine phosphatase-like protein, partial [Catenaria anguillulae PL171]